jgi:hypothetical protein
MILLQFFTNTSTYKRGKFRWYQGLNPGLQLPIMSLMHLLLNSIDADMKSEIGRSRGGLRPYPLRFHVEEAGADAKFNQHGPLEVAYHRRHPISTFPVARITAHPTVPGLSRFYYLRYTSNSSSSKFKHKYWMQITYTRI